MRILFGKRVFCPLLCSLWLCAGIEAAEAGASPEDVRVARAAHIERVHVDSSSLVSVGFAKEVKILEIEFRSGAVYRYLGVPLAIFEGLKKAQSKGQYFTRFIRAKYEFRRVEVPSK